MNVTHVVLPQFHNAGPNLPLLNVAVLRGACRAAGIEMRSVDYRFLPETRDLSPTLRMDYSEHVGELMDLPLLVSIIQAYRRGEDLSRWRIPEEVLWQYMLDTGIDCRGVEHEVSALYACGIRAAEQSLDADAVTASVYVSNLLTVIVFALRLRQLGGPPILLGGPAVTQSGHTRRLLLRGGAADMLLCGDAEGRIAPALRALVTQDKVPIAGALRPGDEIPLGPAHVPCVHWRDTPMPDPDLLDWRHGQPFATTIEATRGCPAACTFCSEHDLHGPVKVRRVQTIIDYIDELRARYRVTRLYFVDSTFDFSRKWMSEFCAAMQTRLAAGLGALWNCQMRADDNMINPAIMYDAGLRACNVGVESFDPDVLLAMNKQTHSEAARAVVYSLLAARVETSVNIITGFPRETDAGLLRTLRTVREIASWAEARGLLRYMHLNLSSFHVRPDSDVYAQPQRFGITMEPHRPAGWGFGVDSDLAQFIGEIPNRFHLQTPDLSARRARRSLMMSDIVRTLGERRQTHDVVTFGWRGESSLMALRDSDLLVLDKDLPRWSTTEGAETLHFVRTGFGVHPLRADHHRFLTMAFGQPTTVRAALDLAAAHFAGNRRDGVRRFIAHLLGQGILTMVSDIGLAPREQPASVPPGTGRDHTNSKAEARHHLAVLS